jgi:hypothetical protein
MIVELYDQIQDALKRACGTLNGKLGVEAWTYVGAETFRFQTFPRWQSMNSDSCESRVINDPETGLEIFVCAYN